MSTTSDGVYAAIGDSGLLEFRDGKATLYDETKGLPGGRVQRVVCYGGKVYLGYDHPGAFVEFDLSEKTFRTLFAFNRGDKSHPFNGRRTYSITGLMGDPQRNCLWIFGAESIRRYDPVSGQLHDPFEGRKCNYQPSAHYSWHQGKILFNGRGNEYGLFDPDTGEVRALVSYKDESDMHYPLDSKGRPPVFGWVADYRELDRFKPCEPGPCILFDDRLVVWGSPWIIYYKDGKRELLELDKYYFYGQRIFPLRAGALLYDRYNVRYMRWNR